MISKLIYLIRYLRFDGFSSTLDYSIRKQNIKPIDVRTFKDFLVKMSKKLAGLYLLMILSLVAPEDGSIYEYNSGNFKHQIEGMDGNFVMFYAPWCRHCTEFEPIWSELAELVNTRDSKFAIAQVDCTRHSQLCHDVDITGYPTLLYFHKNSLTPLEYKGTRDLPSLTMFLSEIFTIRSDLNKQSDQVRIYMGMAYLNDHNTEKFVSKGQHFIMFYTPWCRASQKLSPTWAELAVQYTHNPYIQVGKINCMESEVTCKTFDIKHFPHLMWIANGRIMGMASAESSLNDLNDYVDRMLLAENHDPEKFMKKKKALPVARISEETFETFLEKELVFVNFFAPWCAHCMQLSPLWTALGEKFMNESRVLIADVDCVQSKPICETEKINGLPTLILYKQKKIVNVDHGSKPLDSLINLISEHLGPDMKQEATEQPATKDEL